MLHVVAVTEAFTHIIYAIASIIGVSVFTDCLSSLYASWQRANMRLDDEKWLRENCRDPVFFTNLKSYTTVCSEVEANARVGAFWSALHEVTEGVRLSWQPWMAGWALCAFACLMLLMWLCSGSPLVSVARRREALRDYAYKDALA